MDPAETKIYFM